MQPKKFTREELAMIDQRFMYEKLGKTIREEYKANFGASFEFLPGTRADIVSSFREATEQPYNNIFMDFSVEVALDSLQTTIDTNKRELDELVPVAFACNDHPPAGGRPSKTERFAALKKVYDLVLSGFLTLTDNLTSIVETNLTAYGVIELLAKLLSKEGAKMEDGLLAFEAEERGFSYEESEIRVRSHFDRVCGSRSRFIGELLKLKKLEMYFCMNPEELAMAAQGRSHRSLTSQDLSDTISEVVEALDSAKTAILDMIEVAKAENLTTSHFQDPREVVDKLFQVLRRSVQRIKDFQIECCLFREGLFDASLDTAASVSNLLLSKITALEVLLFVRLAETALVYNLEQIVKEQATTLTSFHKVFDPNFDPKNAEKVVLEVRRDVIMLRSRLGGRMISENEFANASVASRVAKLFARIAILEKHNLRNERELSVHRSIGNKAVSYIKLVRNVENIKYNEQNETYLKINVQSIRELNRVLNELEAALVAFEPLDTVLLQKLREHVEKTRGVLEQKFFEFSNPSLTIKFI